MPRFAIPIVIAPVFMVGCAARPIKPVGTAGTLAELRNVRPDLQEVKVEQGLDQAMQQYRRFLEEAPETAMTPEAMRRLADLQLEKQFGIRTGNSKPREMAAPKPAPVLAGSRAGGPNPAAAAASASLRESDQDFERRTTAEPGMLAGSNGGAAPADTVRAGADAEGPIEAIALYNRLLTEYPSYKDSDQVLYQMARAYDELGRTEEAIATIERVIRTNPHSSHFDEVQFRRGEYFFTRRRYRDAESAYSGIVKLGHASEFYELALYKLGWAFYKQEFYEDALQKYIALLDYKVSIGYDFDQKHDEDNDRRVADTFRVISLSFSNLGGPETMQEHFSKFGNRSYEDRIYSSLGEHYLGKLRYDDAAKTYKAFVALYPFHRAAPRFSMRVVDTFTQGGFPKLVLESKREFASKYGLKAEYWRHFKPEESPEVLAYLKTNLKDLATHYHAQYQNANEAGEKLTNYREASQWYGAYLESFPKEADAASVNYQLADLLLEHKDFGEAARQYERTAYGYAPHPQSAAAGYAAVYAYREQLKVAGEELKDAVKHDTVASSLRFADAFPEHEHAAVAALIRLQDWTAAVSVLEAFRSAYPGHKLQGEATRQIANAYRQSGQLSRAADEYDRVASQSEDPASRSEALLVAGDLYEQS